MTSQQPGNSRSKTENDGRKANSFDFPNNVELHARFKEIEQLISENIPDRIFAKDIEGRYVFMNRSNHEFWGIPLGKVLGKTDWDIHNEVTAKTFTDSDRLVLETGEHCCVEECVKTRNGRDVIVSVIKTPIKNKDGKIIGIAGASRDITATKQLEKKLKTSHLLLQKILESLNHAVFIIDPGTFKITNCNPAASEIFGYPRNEMLENTFGFLHVAPASFKAFVEHVHNGIADSGALFLPEFKMKRKGGTAFPTEINLFPVKNEQGEFTDWVSVIRDTSERKRTKSALKKSEDRYRMLVDTMSEAVGVQDENGRLMYVNNRYMKMLGYSREEIIGHSPHEFMDKANQKILKTQQKKRRKGEKEPYEITWTGKDGRKIHTIVSPRGIFSQDGAYKGAFAVITDITEVKETLQVLEDKEKELEIKSDHLEETNAALRVLLKRRDKDKAKLEEKIMLNVKELIMPYIRKMNKTRLSGPQKTYLGLLESNLKEIISPFAQNISSAYLNLTPAEIQIADFIRQGHSTNEIARILTLSTRTVETHRINIRKKMGIKNSKANLRTFVSKLQQY